MNMLKTLKTASVATAVLLASVGAAQAQELVLRAGEIGWTDVPSVSQKTRTEVLAELAQARRDGTAVRPGQAGAPEARFVAQRSRADVVAETRAAVVAGELYRSEAVAQSWQGYPLALRQHTTITPANPAVALAAK